MQHLVRGDSGGPGRPGAEGDKVNFPWHYCPSCGRIVSGGGPLCQHCATISALQSQEPGPAVEKQSTPMINQAASTRPGLRLGHFPVFAWLAVTLIGLGLISYLISDVARSKEPVNRIDVTATVQAAVATAVAEERMQQAAVATALAVERLKLPGAPAPDAGVAPVPPPGMRSPPENRMALNGGGPETLPTGAVVYRGTIKNWDDNWAATGLDLYVEILDPTRNLIRKDRARILWEGRLGPGQEAKWEYPVPRELKPGETVSIGPLRWDWVPAY